MFSALQNLPIYAETWPDINNNNQKNRIKWLECGIRSNNDAVSKMVCCYTLSWYFGWLKTLFTCTYDYAGLTFGCSTFFIKWLTTRNDTDWNLRWVLVLGLQPFCLQIFSFIAFVLHFHFLSKSFSSPHTSSLFQLFYCFLYFSSLSTDYVFSSRFLARRYRTFSSWCGKCVVTRWNRKRTATKFDAWHRWLKW